MKKTSKWPSRVLNLLMVLAMVISLSAILVAPPAAGAQSEPCSQTPIYNGCHLDVAVATYVKNLDTGAFTPQSSFTPGQCFYVNAVVVNDGNATASAPINATIVLPGDGSVTLDTNDVATKVSDTDLQGSPNSSEPHRMVDFWWRVCCEAANGNATIGVNVTADSQCDQEWPAYGETVVFQGTSVTGKCVTLEIVEAPGMPNKVGHLGDYFEDPDTASGVVNPCTNFGIKAEITNNCDDPIDVGNLVITWPGEGDASIVGGDYNYWTVGWLQPGQTQAVAWTLHCESPGDVNVTVTPTMNEQYVNYIDDAWTVHQKTPGGLTVTITRPTEGLGCDGSTLVIKQPSPPPASICSNLAAFTVTAVVTNNGDSYVDGVSVSAAVNKASWVTITNPGSLYNLAPNGGNVTVNFPANCIGTGLGNITVSAAGTDTGTGLAVYSQSDPSDTRWWRTIDQTQVIAQQTPDVTTPAETNICNPDGFDVSFRYTNYTNNSWTAPANGNITACITWTGNVTLDGNVSYRRITGGVETAWVNLGPTSPTDSTDCEQVRTDITPLIPAICPCCSVDVKWHFVCTGPGPVTFQSNITVQQISPAFTGTDTSEPVCVDQVWKAHLIGDVFFFVQDSNNLMVEQDAVTPGTNFHVVIPVENTGDATAQSVQVYFTITDQPTGNCLHSYQFENYSGDGSLTVVGTSGNSTTYIANLGDIPGHSAKKAILYMQCLCEGTVSVWIVNDVGIWGDVQGIRAFDANTGDAVPQANILIPPCPLVFEQMPFTIVMENPQTCDTFTEGTMFPVKAKITNGSQNTDLNNVSATLNWNANAEVELVEGNQTLNGDSHSCTKLVGNITAGTSGEITWELVCTGGGEVYFNVYASVTSPLLTVYSAPNPEFPPYTVNVHQIGIPTACLKVIILSPDNHESDNPDNNGQVMIATGQQFAVSAKVYNSGPDPAANVVATLDPSCEYPGGFVSLADGQSDTINLGTIDDGDFLVATWTLVGGGGNDWGLKDCSVKTDDICVNATTDTNTTCEASDNVEVSIYPAAFLVTTMDITPSTGIVLGDQFVVDYTVTNYGVADATSAALTLAADNSNVHIAAGTGGWTQTLGTIPGWSFGEPYNSVSGNFTLQCTAAGLSTLSLTPTGQDECGWQPVTGWTSWQKLYYWDSETPGPNGILTKEDTNIQWVQLGLSPIWSGFLAPDSETIMQSATGACPDLTSVDIDLNAGWNLISLPLMPTNGNVSALFSGKPVDAIWSYSGGVWSSPTTMVDGQGYWVHMTAAATLTENGKVNPLPPQTPPTYTVATGWNLMGFKSTCARTAMDYLGSAPWVRIWSYANGAWSAVNSSDKMQPGLGYWIAATSAGTIYP